MQPLPWSDPCLRFSSAPVVDDGQSTEELQTTSVVSDAPASGESMGLGHVQLAEQVWMCTFCHHLGMNTYLCAGVLV